MKVMHLLQSSVFSGAENVVCQIMKMFSDNEDIEMIYVSTDGPVRTNIESQGYTYVGLDKISYKQVRKIINHYHPDIIHAHDITASILAALCSIGTNIRIISHVHVNNDDMTRFNMKTLLYYLSSFKYKHIFWVSKSCYESYFYRKRLKFKSEVLCNVMDKDDIINKAKEHELNPIYDILYVGRIVYQKNPERLMSILKKILDVKPDCKIGVVGAGDMFDQTINYAKDLGIDNHIDFLGYQSNPLKYLYRSKVMIMTSRYEGLPMTVLEALALGIPIVSTPVDGLKEVIENGKEGFLSNDDNELVEKILLIINDSHLRSILSKNAKNKFANICDLKEYKKRIKHAYCHE